MEIDKPLLFIKEDQYQPESDTLNMSDIISNYARLMIKAQITISRAFRKFHFRRLAKKRIFVVDLWFSHGLDAHSKVSVVGEFSSKVWEEKVELLYSIQHRCYTAKVNMTSW